MEKTIIDFSLTDEQNHWETINDAVMGGISTSRMFVSENNTAIFQGEVSLENYGGFASIRTRPRKFGLNGFQGLEVRILGDGKAYRLRLKTDDDYEGIAYQAHFSTSPGEWILVRLPFDSFTPVFRGRVVSDAPQLNIDAVRRIGFMVADKQAGPFRLEIKWVKAYY
jgi:monofunctional biosynthetic peptidoglycan transglycosylase